MQEISTRTKSSKTTLRSGAVQGVKKPFVSKKCIFWPENDVFSKKSFYSKLIRDENYIICTCQKIFFLKKIMRLQFSPDFTQLQNKQCLSQRLRSLGRDNLLLPSTFPQLVGIQIPETTKLKCVEFPHIICHVSFCL